MLIRGIIAVLLVICCLSIEAQQPDCNKLKERCEACMRRNNNPADRADFMNRDCRQKVGRQWVWRDLNRCHYQVIACRVHNRKLDCGVIAELAGMQRRLP